MADEGWIEEEGPAEPRKGIPGWLWFCGGGCLLAIVLGIVVTVLMVKVVKEGLDPERQWGRLAEILPYDEQPEHMTMLFGWGIGMDVFVLNDDRGYMWMVQHRGSGSEQDRDNMMSQFSGGEEQAETGELAVQGRTLAVQRFYQEEGFDWGTAPGQPEVKGGATAVLDLTAPGEAGFTILVLIHANSPDPIPDESIQDLLRPFQIGPDRIPYTRPVELPEEATPPPEEPGDDGK